MGYSIFISGEGINLCVPSKQALEDGWTEWFNNPNTTRFLSHGVFPNYPEDQQAFLDSLRSRARFAVLVCDKDNKLHGIVSLSAIDWMARSAQISLVVPIKSETNKLMALEAMALVTTHAFETMGITRLWAGQAYPGLAAWSNRLTLLGYMPDGILRNGFTKGDSASDAVTISCLIKDYRTLKHRRSGKFWAGNAQMQRLVDSLPMPPLAERIDKAIKEQHIAFYAELQKAESKV